MIDLTSGDKDPVAVEGFKLGLESVDVVLKGALDLVQLKVTALDRRSVTAHIGSVEVASLLRLIIQKQTIEGLRLAIPALILDGDATKLTSVIG